MSENEVRGTAYISVNKQNWQSSLNHYVTPVVLLILDFLVCYGAAKLAALIVEPIVGKTLNVGRAWYTILLVETDDVIVVAKKGESQKVKTVVEKLKKMGRKEAVEHTTMYHRWGTSTVIGQGEGYRMKKVRVMPGKAITMQMHYHRTEHWVVLRGTAEVTRGDETTMIHERESIFIPQTTKHKLANPGRIPLEIIEIQNGSYIGEDDIVRFE